MFLTYVGTFCCAQFACCHVSHVSHKFAHFGTFADEDTLDTVEEEAEPEPEKKEMMTRKGSWHSHISQRTRQQELSIGGNMV